MLKFIVIMLMTISVKVILTTILLAGKLSKVCHQHFCRRNSWSTTEHRLLYQVQTYFSSPSFVLQHSFWNMQQLPCPFSYTERESTQKLSLITKVHTCMLSWWIEVWSQAGRHAWSYEWSASFFILATQDACSKKLQGLKSLISKCCSSYLNIFISKCLF